MSRSKHVTVKGVFGGKTKKQIEAMISENDPEVEALRQKKRSKLNAKRETREQKAIDFISKETKTSNK